MDEKRQVGIIGSTCWAQRLYNEATREMLHFKPSPTHPSTRWWRFKRRVTLFLERVHDAWLVLIGHAAIRDPYDD